MELQSSFFADASSTQWLVDSGVSRHMCFDKSSFDPGTLSEGSLLRVSGVVMGNGSLASILGTGQVTIYTHVGKHIQTLV